jgi:hypothetical protein
VTTSQLRVLNRNIDILYRHSLGEPVAGIARHHHLTAQRVGFIIAKYKGDQRLIEAVEDRKALKYAALEKENDNNEFKWPS